MDGLVQDGEVDDHFDAVLVGDGVLVRMSDNAGATLAHHVGALIRFLERDEVRLEHTGFLGRQPSVAEVLRRMYPDVYENRARSDDFRTRHAAVLRDSAAAHRVWARCVGETPFVLAHGEVDEWLTTMALARALHRPRGVSCVTSVWLNHVRTSLVLAVEPRLGAGW